MAKTKVLEFQSSKKLLVEFALSNNVTFGVEGADNVFIALEGHGGLFASSGGHFNGHRTVSILDSGNFVALSVLFIVGVARSERIGASPEFDSVQHETVNEAPADAVDAEDEQDEVNDRVEPLVAQRAVPLVELLEASVAAIAARENDHASAKKRNDTFFHFITP
mgnify:CR=1 FL=1